MVMERYMGYWAVYLGMMGDEGRADAAPDEPHRRGAAALLSCTESLRGHQHQCCAQPMSLKWHASGKTLHASFLMGVANGRCVPSTGHMSFIWQRRLDTLRPLKESHLPTGLLLPMCAGHSVMAGHV